MRKAIMSRMYARNCRKQWMVAGLIVLGMLLGSVTPVAAEIYKWQDENGVIFYSNKPPLDQSRILSIMPSQNLPVEKEEKDGVYYFKLSDGGAPADSEITISAEQLQELLREVPPRTGPLAQPSIDMTALTMRLSEIEKALTQEIDNRSQWQLEYAQSQSSVKNLERQNSTLRLALARMEDEMQKIQGLVIASDVQASMAQIPQNGQQLAMLEGKVEDMQTHVTTLSQEVGTWRGLALSERIAALAANVQKLETQQQPDDAMLMRLASLETEMGQLTEVVNVQKLEAQQPDEALLMRLASLETEMGQLTEVVNVQKLEAQQQPDDAMLMRLASLETEMGQLTEVVNTQKLEAQQPDEALLMRLASLETEMGQLTEVVNTQKLEAQQPDDALLMRLASLETEMGQLTAVVNTQKLEAQQPDETMLMRLASLETEMGQLTEMVPVSRETTGTVAELAKDGSLLKTITEYQAKQLGEQQGQILALKGDFMQVQSGMAALEEQINAQYDPASELLLTELAVKNQRMQAIVKQQAELLKAQSEQMQSIEARLAQLQVPAVKLEQTIPVGGIKVVPRIERRRSSYMMRFWGWLNEVNREG